jgi:hypothetical protein
VLAISTFNAPTQAVEKLNDNFTHGRRQHRDRRIRPPAAGHGSKKRHHQWSPRSSARPFRSTYQRLNLALCDASVLKAQVMLQELLCIGQRGHLHETVGIQRLAAQARQAEEWTPINRGFFVRKRRHQEMDLAQNHK